jgi:hypothetical protein
MAENLRKFQITAKYVRLGVRVNVENLGQTRINPGDGQPIDKHHRNSINRRENFFAGKTFSIVYKKTYELHFCFLTYAPSFSSGFVKIMLKP